MTDLYFAPMEGITDISYRKAIVELFPEWDFVSTDFLRVPTVGKISKKMIIEHYGSEFYEQEILKEKTILQILTTPNAQTEECVKIINDLAFPRLDLNLGCPSRKVNAHLGGSYLLSVPSELLKIIRTIRKNFHYKFSVKMRIGYNDDSHFVENLKMLEQEGVDTVILHARTKKEMYKGVADWSYIKQAKENLNITFIGNGDIWVPSDIDRMVKETGCDHVMIGRGAMKTPWLAYLYRNNIHDKKQMVAFAKDIMPKYYQTLQNNYLAQKMSDEIVLKRMKAISRYLFDDFSNGEEIKKMCFRTTSLRDFNNFLRMVE